MDEPLDPPPPLNGPPHLDPARIAKLSDWGGKRVTVMGLGWHGGQIAAIKYLARRGARLTVTDLLPEAELTDSLAALDGYPIEKFVLGRHDEDDFRTAEAVVVAPAVKPGNRYVRLAADAGALITSEIELAIAETPGPLIGITGTVGKSTTATMCRDMLRAAGRRVRLVGNIGESLLDAVDDPEDEFSAEDVTIFELSSFQLVRLEGCTFRPDVSAVTNVFPPHHAAWHGGEESYVTAKLSIFKQQQRGDYVVAGFQLETHRLPPEHERAFETVYAGCRDNTPVERSGLLMLDCPVAHVGSGRGRRGIECPSRGFDIHYEFNAQVAAHVAYVCGTATATIGSSLERFQYLPHRIERIAAVGRVMFFDDSKATSIDSVRTALRTLRLDAPNAETILLLGGDTSFSEEDILPLGPFHDAPIVAYGHAAESVRRILDYKTWVATDLDSAFRVAITFASYLSLFDAGAVQVLLSPGCPSQPTYRDYKERGEHFRRLVEDYRQRIEGEARKPEA